MDLHTLTNAQGEIFYFDNSSAQYFLSYGNYGMPPVNYLTRKGYKQVGVTEIDYTFEPRLINIQLFTPKKQTRIEYYQERQRFVDFMRQNRGELILTLILADNMRRAIRLRPDPGLIFPAKSPTVADWNIDEEVSFTAFNPLWYNPLQQIANSVRGGGHLIFPATFPVMFTGDYFDATITYTGTWREYPVFTFEGPYSNVLIRHITTGAQIEIVYPIVAGETRILNLAQGQQTFVDGNGNDKFYEISPSSEIVNFALFPEPEVAGGVNVLQVQINGGTTITTLEISYYERYIGI